MKKDSRKQGKTEKKTQKKGQAERKEERKITLFQLQKVYSNDMQPMTRNAVAANE
jgi:hypothetical protein